MIIDLMSKIFLDMLRFSLFISIIEILLREDKSPDC